MTAANMLKLFHLWLYRCEREINSLIEMLKVQYSAPSEVRIARTLLSLRERRSHAAAVFLSGRRQMQSLLGYGSYYARLQLSTECSCDATTSAFLFPRIATASSHI